jgi:hypothetical protein
MMFFDGLDLDARSIQSVEASKRLWMVPTPIGEPAIDLTSDGGAILAPFFHALPAQRLNDSAD